ncbi:hypothetical protein B484DRAFT_392916, partial [Ochromonadaceae sp. CCMP2298]
MIIEVKVKDQNVSISVGDGKQTFKWLASVVQARIQQYGVLKSRFENDNYIVTEVRNKSGELINPADRLYEHADLGKCSVTAIVATSFPVGMTAFTVFITVFITVFTPVFTVSITIFTVFTVFTVFTLSITVFNVFITVFTVFITVFTVDEWENPQMGEWMKSAVVKSGVGANWHSEIDAWRDSYAAGSADPHT